MSEYLGNWISISSVGLSKVSCSFTTTTLKNHSPGNKSSNLALILLFSIPPSFSRVNIAPCVHVKVPYLFVYSGGVPKFPMI